MMDLIDWAIATALPLGVLALLIWLVGSIALRFIGWGWIFFGAAILLHGATASTAIAATYALAIFNIGVGTMLWFCGHALYAARHRHWKSPVARWIGRTTTAPLRRLRSAPPTTTTTRHAHV